jgi:hypothetical protein
MRPEATDAGLRNTQRWMQRAIIGPVPPGAGQSRKMVLPSRSLNPQQRVGIYRGMYEARLLEALEVDYPGLLAFLGQEQFQQLMSSYIRSHPSRSYTLNRLGDALPGFLEEYEGLPRAGFVRDLARLELTYTEVFDEAQTGPLTKKAVAKVHAGAWEKARLKPIAAFRLIAMRYPAQLFLRALREERKPPPIRRKHTWLVVYRRDYACMVLELTKPAYVMLSALAAGKTLGDAILAGRMNTPARHVLLTEWFREWTAEGLFQAVHF